MVEEAVDPFSPGKMAASCGSEMQFERAGVIFLLEALRCPGLNMCFGRFPFLLKDFCYVNRCAFSFFPIFHKNKGVSSTPFLKQNDGNGELRQKPRIFF